MKLDEDDSTGNNDLPITSGTTLILTNERFNIDLDKATWGSDNTCRRSFSPRCQVTGNNTGGTGKTIRGPQGLQIDDSKIR